MIKKPNKDLITYIKHINKKHPRTKFEPYIWIRRDVGVIQLFLSPNEIYHVPIAGEQALVSTHHDLITNKVVGVTLDLPKDFKKIKIIDDK